jgi:putative Mn2+ efflux pump MntP
MTVLFLGLLTGIDNFVLGAGMGAMRLARGHLVALVLACGLAEALMPLAGFALAGTVAPGLAEGLGPVLLVIAGLLVAGRVALGLPRLSGWLLAALPVVLALDNLAAGAGMGALGGFAPLSALASGAVAAGLGLAGIALGRRVPVGAPAMVQAAFACGLIALGVADMVGGA